MDRATLAAWVGTGAAEIVSVVRRMKAILLGSARLFADKTSVPVLTRAVAGPRPAGSGRSRATTGPGAGRSRRRSSTPAPGRGREHTRALLGGYGGILQCDGYAGYKTLAAPATGRGPAVVAFCWSHARRQFCDLALKAKAPSAEEALRRIAELHAIEAAIRGTPPERRLADRHSRSRPLVEELFAWFEATLAKLPARSTMADAVRYALNHRDGRLRFLGDGRIELDANSV